MSRIVLTNRNTIDRPALGKSAIYAKNNALALMDSEGNEFILADTRFLTNALPRRIFTGRTRLTAAQVAGTYWFTDQATLATSGLATPLNTIHIEQSDFPDVAGVVAKLRLRVQLYTNDVAPGGNISVALYPITRPATSGGAGVLIYTPGTAVAGSVVTFTAPAADGMFASVSAEFNVPATGHYALGLVTTSTIATSAHVHINCQVQVRN